MKSSDSLGTLSALYPTALTRTPVARSPEMYSHHRCPQKNNAGIGVTMDHHQLMAAQSITVLITSPRGASDQIPITHRAD
jgi:hypothetical protein